MPRSLHQAAATIGLLGIGFPEDVGGSGGDLLDTITVTEAIIENGARRRVVIHALRMGVDIA